MKIIVSKDNISAVVQFKDLAVSMRNKKFHTELHRGVIDAGRKTKTKVQRVVTRQMALKPGNYQGYVVANTRGVPRKANLSYEIFSVAKGTNVEKYKGLKSVAAGGRAFRRMNKGRSVMESGTVRSSVWNTPRLFKRSFETGGNFYAMRPGGKSTTAPKILWTFGAKPTQPRGPNGRFASPGTKYGKIRRLFGPALSKEIPKDASLAEFQRFAPVELSRQVEKRLAKLMRF